MQKIFFITFAAVLILISSEAQAQEGKGDKKPFNREAFEARRNAFITAEVGLTPEEAERFIPLCDELRRKKFELGKACRKLTKELLQKENPSDADYNRAIDECLEADIREAELEKEYFEKFRQILSPEKIFKYRNAEAKFVRNFMRGGTGEKRK